MSGGLYVMRQRHPDLPSIEDIKGRCEAVWQRTAALGPRERQRQRSPAPPLGNCCAGCGVPPNRGVLRALNMGGIMAKTARGRKQDRARVAGGQGYEVAYESRKTGRSKGAVKKAAKKAGPSRKKVERAIKKK
jgi:hypothetical protein